MRLRLHNPEEDPWFWKERKYCLDMPNGGTKVWARWLRMQNTYRDRFGQTMPGPLREQLLKDFL